MERNGVSVIIPCYNDGIYLMDAIRSVQKQTYPYVEIIVIDDASTDLTTKQILSELAGGGIKVLCIDHAGPAAARNRGIREAQGHYIFPLDADDKIEATYLEKAVMALSGNDKAGIVYCHAELFGKEKGRWELPDYSLDRMLLDNIIFASALFYREDWERIGGYCEDLTMGMEDYDFWLSILELGKDVIQLPEVLFWYRIKEKSRTKQLKGNASDIQMAYQMIFENHRELYRANYDTVIPALRGALMEQRYMREKLEGILGIVGLVRRVPFLRKVFRKLLK